MNIFSKLVAYLGSRGVLGKILLVHAFIFLLFLFGLLPWWRPTWIYGAFFLLAGAEAFVLIAGISAALLSLKAVTNPSEFGDAAKKVTRFLAALAFWILMMAILFHDIPSETHPAKVLFLVSVFVALALGTYCGVLYLSWQVFSRFFTAQLIVAVVVGLFAVRFPYQYEHFKIWASDKLTLSQPVSLIDTTGIDDPENYVFWGADGKPLRYYAKLPDGKFILAAVPGYHGPTRAQLKPVETTQQRQEIVNWLKANRTENELVKRVASTAEAERSKQQQMESDAKAREAAAIETAKRKEEARVDRIQKQARYFAQIADAHAEGKPRIALVVADKRETDSNLTDAASSMAARSGFVVLKGLLKPEFVSDGLFESAFDGRWDSLKDLNFQSRCEVLALCQFVTTVEARPAFQNVKAASGKLRIRLLRAETGSKIYDQEYEVMGTAFETEKAIGLVREKLVGLLTTNTLPQAALNK